ncbi:MAG: PIN domain-containing protein [Steroidobacteraceae bacterium]
MDILVSDTSILIDLERAGLEAVAFPLGHRWVVPNLLYESELRTSTGPAWVQRGLEVLELSPEELAIAQRHFQQHRTVSLNDCAAFALASHHEWVLLTGDSALRKLCGEHGVACHGLLWVVELARGAGADVVRLDAGVRQLLAHPRCRLPRAETEAVLRRLLDR